jgi:hypothetical protein
VSEPLTTLVGLAVLVGAAAGVYLALMVRRAWKGRRR